MSILTDELYFQMTALDFPEPIFEHRFHPIRRWRFDFAWIRCIVDLWGKIGQKTRNLYQEKHV